MRSDYLELWFSEPMNFPQESGFNWNKIVDVIIDGIDFTYDVVYLNNRTLAVNMVFMQHVDAKFVVIRFKSELIFSNYDDNFPLESKLVTI